MAVFAHLSDLHLDGTERSVERARRVVDHLTAMPGPLDMVLCTGDVADHGAVEEYRAARALLETLPCPWFALPGNHDRRAPFVEELLGRDASDGPVNQNVTVAGAQFLLCDSTVPDQSHGRLDDDTLAWLDDALSTGPPELPALVSGHHPPVPLHLPQLDAIRLAEADRLAEVVDRHPRVVALLCGHAHTAAFSTFAGRPLVVAPGVASTLRMPLEAADQLDLLHPSGFVVHVVDAAARLTTHVRAVDLPREPGDATR